MRRRSATFYLRVALIGSFLCGMIFGSMFTNEKVDFFGLVLFYVCSGLTVFSYQCAWRDTNDR